MKRVVQIVGLSIGATVLVLAVMGLVLPTHYRVERTILINAPAAMVHPWVEDLQRWPAWANWNHSDPTLVTTYTAVSSGVGAGETWRSERAGSGTRTIIRSDATSGVEFNTELGDGTLCKGKFLYKESAGTTTITWTDQGQLPRLIGGFSKGAFEDTVGEHMDEGLKRLKRIVEQRARARLPSHP
jgi:hypothetical protein